MRLGAVMLRLTALAIIGTACGCADLQGVLDHLMGAPEAAPPLGTSFLDSFAGFLLPSDGRPIPPDINGGREPNANDVGVSQSPLEPAQGAVQADLAGIWVHAMGYGAIHVDEAGRVYQVDLADSIDGTPVPDIVPRTLFDVGAATVTDDGRVQGDMSVSLFGLSASGALTGMLDSTRNIVYAVTLDMTVERGNGPEQGVDHSPWLRWDPQTGVLAQ